MTLARPLGVWRWGGTRGSEGALCRGRSGKHMEKRNKLTGERRFAGEAGLLKD